VILKGTYVAEGWEIFDREVRDEGYVTENDAGRVSVAYAMENETVSFECCSLAKVDDGEMRVVEIVIFFRRAATKSINFDNWE